MKIAIAGYSGLIGRRFLEDFKENDIVKLSRELLYGEVEMLENAIRGSDLVINLAGSPINKRWTRKNKRIIEESRIKVNMHLVEAINRLKQKPVQFITASATGIYDTTGIHTETSNNPAENYIASVVRFWEKPLEKLHGSVMASILRIGIVLAREGGIIYFLLKASRTGFLPVLGSGKQIYSFVHMDDLMGAIRHIISEKKQGIYNVCSPNPVDNATFTRSFSKNRGVKLIFRIPTFILRASLGEAHIMVTQGPYVLPARLLKDGFVFRFPDIDIAFQNLVQKH
jgi:hypothetical protein